MNILRAGGRELVKMAPNGFENGCLGGFQVYFCRVDSG